MNGEVSQRYTGAKGYANEVGEAFRALVPVSLVWGSYAVATAYVTADAVDKGKKAAVAHGDNPGKTARVAVAVVDTFVWQALASVIIPGFTINRVCAASLHVLGKTTKWPLPVRKWTTTAIGLSTIPFIITPIDRLAKVYCFFLCRPVDHVSCLLCVPRYIQGQWVVADENPQYEDSDGQYVEVEDSMWPESPPELTEQVTVKDQNSLTTPEPYVVKEQDEVEESAVWKIVLVVAVLLVFMVGSVSVAYYLCVWRGGRIHYQPQKEGYA
ncbi:hypothetical protein L3Q82_012626 [Scortum barcoo]|uniref:Uncharacterized protein n=1 Tax=Scortum barcoo TaxID=214431 RepID=A0ACB8W3G1_9TELE|nr:hypothetical protein L3Q82_012626 [Scortum barcoo]